MINTQRHRRNCRKRWRRIAKRMMLTHKTCCHCNRVLDHKLLSVEHIIPIREYVDQWPVVEPPNNIEICCIKCNQGNVMTCYETYQRRLGQINSVLQQSIKCQGWETIIFKLFKKHKINRLGKRILQEKYENFSILGAFI